MQISAEKSRLGAFTFISVGLLLLFCAWIPLYQGSNRAVLWAFNGMAVAFLFCLVHLTNNGERDHLPRAWIGFVVLIALVGWVGTAGVRGLVLMPFDAQSGSLDSLLTGPPLISFSPSDSLLVCLVMMSFAMLWSLSRRLASTLGAQTLLLLLLVIFGLHAALGFLEITVDYEFPLTEPNFDDFGAVADGGFANRNTFATYLGLGAVVALALTMRSLSVLNTSALPVLQLSTALLSSFVLLLILTALLLTQSRMGAASTVSALVMVILSFGFVYRAWIVTGVFLSLVVFGTLAGGYASVELLERIDDSGADFQTRLLVYQEGLSLWMQRPMTGFGAGSFETIFGAFKSEAVAWAIWDMAHNTYVTALFELGSLGSALMLILFLWLTLHQLRTLRRDQGIAGLVGLGGLIVVGLHACLDYSLEIYAVTATLMVMLGIGAAPLSDPPHQSSLPPKINKATAKPVTEQFYPEFANTSDRPRARRFKPSAAPLKNPMQKGS